MVVATHLRQPAGICRTADGGTPRQMTSDYPISGTVSRMPTASRSSSSNRRENVEYHPRQNDLYAASLTTVSLPK